MNKKSMQNEKFMKKLLTFCVKKLSQIIWSKNLIKLLGNISDLDQWLSIHHLCKYLPLQVP